MEHTNKTQVNEDQEQLLQRSETARGLSFASAQELIDETIKLDPLGEKDIKIAQLKINHMHPLNRLGFSELFPFIFFCCKHHNSQSKREREFKDYYMGEMKHIEDRLNTILADNGSSDYKGTDLIQDQKQVWDLQHANKKTNQQDPFAVYGFGITAYFVLMRSLICTYLLMSLLACGMMYIYSQGNAIELDDDAATAAYSLGNLGYAKHKCYFQPYSVDVEQELRCKAGKIGNLTYFGVIPYFADADEVIRSDFCGDPELIKQNLTQEGNRQDCAAMIDVDKMREEFHRTCDGQVHCRFNLAGYFRNIDLVPDSCTSEGAKAYIQFGCEISGEHVKFNQKRALTVVTISIIMCLGYFCTIYYLQNAAPNDFKVWDVQSCTPSDFTIMLEITDTMHSWYLREKQRYPGL